MCEVITIDEDSEEEWSLERLQQSHRQVECLAEQELSTYPESFKRTLTSVGYERKFFELERAERKNFRAEPSASDITRNDFRAEPSSSGKSFERLRARAKPSEHKSFFEHDFLFNFEHSRAEFER